MRKTVLTGTVVAIVVVLFTLQSCEKEMAGSEVINNKPDDQVSENLYTVSTIAGNTDAGFLDGKGPEARFSDLRGIAISADKRLFVAEGANSAIREVNPADSQVTTLAGNGTFGFANGRGRNATFNLPNDVTMGRNGNLYVTDFFNFRIREITRAGDVSTFAGADSGHVDGPLNQAQFSKLFSIVVCSDGIMYVADNFKIRKISVDGTVSTIAGSTPGYQDGPGKDAKFGAVLDIAVAKDGALYLADPENNAIRKISGGIVSTVVKSSSGYLDGPLSNAQFSLPSGLAFGEDGSLYVADYGNHRIRKISSDNMVSTIAGSRSILDNQFADGPGATAKFYYPHGLAIYKNELYVGDTGNNRIRKVALE